MANISNEQYKKEILEAYNQGIAKGIEIAAYQITIDYFVTDQLDNSVDPEAIIDDIKYKYLM